MEQSLSPGSTPVVREHRLLVDDLDNSVIDMLNVNAAAVVYLRRTKSGGHRGSGIDVFNEWDACFRKVTSMTRHLPEITNDKKTMPVMEKVDWWDNCNEAPSADLLARGRKILDEYLKMLYEKGIIQIKR
jgi:hypothetical protein